MAVHYGKLGDFSRTPPAQHTPRPLSTYYIIRTLVPLKSSVSSHWQQKTSVSFSSNCEFCNANKTMSGTWRPGQEAAERLGRPRSKEQKHQSPAKEEMEGRKVGR